MGPTIGGNSIGAWCIRKSWFDRGSPPEPGVSDGGNSPPKLAPGVGQEEEARPPWPTPVEGEPVSVDQVDINVVKVQESEESGVGVVLSSARREAENVGRKELLPALDDARLGFYHLANLVETLVVDVHQEEHPE